MFDSRGGLREGPLPCRRSNRLRSHLRASLLRGKRPLLRIPSLAADRAGRRKNAPQGPRETFSPGRLSRGAAFEDAAGAGGLPAAQLRRRSARHFRMFCPGVSRTPPGGGFVGVCATLTVNLSVTRDSHNIHGNIHTTS